MTPQEVEYTRSKYKQTVQNYVLDKKFEDKCDDYWNL